MFQKIVLFSGLLFLASCQSEVCECADQWLEMTNKCENMDANKTAAEKEQMLEELRSCESYKKIGKE
jgi:hypothetical protein